jgi:histidyl-tRNA synthetase
MKYSRPRGTQDILPPDSYVWQYVEGVFSATLARYAYEPVRTPIFEPTDLFFRSVGEGTDIVSKEMYTFTDRGGRSLTLRPENTAAVIRAFLENGLHRAGGITRLGYIGPMFRYDRPQAGRYRQFHQVGAEAIGSLNPMVDVEIIDLVLSGLETLGFANLSVRLNSVGCRVCRAPYAGVLKEALAVRSEHLCEDCRERTKTNPLRVFDCKKCGDIKRDLPRISEHLCEECSSHFVRVKELMTSVGRAFEEDPELVRGLDYYTKTTFEILHGDLGAQNALCGGGRYDDLVEECGGPSTPAVGFSAGIERIISVLPKSEVNAGLKRSGPDYYVAVVDDSSAPRAMRAAATLRRHGSVCVDASLRVLKKQLKAAEKNGARYTVIVDSADPERVALKDMKARTQSDVLDSELGEVEDAK